MNRAIQMRKSLHKQKGMSLIEIAIALTIIAVIVYGIVHAGSDQSNSSKVETESKNVTQLLDNISEYFQGSAYTGLDTDMAKNAGLFPSALIRSGGNIEHSFKGAVSVAPASVGGGSDNAVAVTYSAVPGGAVCSKLVVKTEPMAEQIDVAGTNVKPYQGSLDRAALATACNANQVDIVWTRR